MPVSLLAASAAALPSTYPPVPNYRDVNPDRAHPELWHRTRLAFWEPKELTNESEQLIIGMVSSQEAGWMEIKYCAGRVEVCPKPF